MGFCFALLFTVACSPSAVDPDAGVRGPIDSGAIDSGAVDSGAIDSGGPDAARPDAGPVTALEFRYTEHLGQLTGTTLNPVLPLGFSGTDLGVAFARDGKVAFLFGDAWIDNRDQMALAPLTLPDEGMPELTFITTADGHFQPLSVPGVDLGAFNVPVEAVPVGDRTYYFFTTGYDFGAGRHSHSVLAHGQGLNIDALVLDHKVRSDKFFNIQVVVEDGEAWIFASGLYRRSPVYLARVELARIADRGAWRYWPDFVEGAGEAAAEPLIDVSCVGELSVRRHPATGLWLMAYNCGTPERGIHLRTSTGPTGPWSEPQLIYTPGMGYQHFIHANESVVGYDDGLSWPGREDDWGGEYGPYLIPEWFSSPGPGLHELVYTLSSWNPYQVHLMRTVLAEPGVAAEAPVYGEGLPPALVENGDFAGGSTAGWTQEGGPFGTFQRDDGTWRLTTFGGAEEGTTGRLWQEFQIDADTSELRFWVHGGDARVELHVGDEVVRSTHGRRDNATELEVRWNLEQLRGERVRLVVVDDLTGPWGFVGAGGFELR